MGEARKILVTGGAGYVGTVVVPMLLEQGHEVVILDNFLFGFGPVLHFATHPKVRIINGDARRRDDLRAALEGVDDVIHLAAIVGFPACAADENAAVSTNYDSTVLLLELMRPGQRLIYASTGSCYGRAETFCDENTPINPLTVYARTKADSEVAILESPHAENSVVLRFATVFGAAPRLRLDLIVNDFTYKAVNDRIIVLYEGHFKRTFLHIRDAAQCYLTVIDNFDAMKGRVFNVGDERLNHTKRDVALAIQEQLEFELYETDVGTDLDARNYHVSFDRIQEFGFRSTVSLAEGISELLDICSFVRIRMPYRNA
jgi:nucleoside-diphosphate-sugar epimerase